MISRLLVLLTLGFSINAFAADEDCVISKSRVLDRNDVFACEGDIILLPGIEIVYHEFKIKWLTAGKVVYGSPEKPATVRCMAANDTYKMEGKGCGEVVVQADRLEGSVAVNGEAPDAASGSVKIEVAQFSGNLRLNLHTGEGGGVPQFIMGGVAQPTKINWLN